MTQWSTLATYCRPSLLGTERTARRRLGAGVWAARVYAIAAAIPTIASALLETQSTVAELIVSAALAVVAVVASFRIARGSRRTAVVLLAIFLIDVALVVASSGYPAFLQCALIAIVSFGLVQGVWGAFSLKAIAEERARAAAAQDAQRLRPV